MVLFKYSSTRYKNDKRSDNKFERLLFLQLGCTHQAPAIEAAIARKIIPTIKPATAAPKYAPELTTDFLFTKKMITPTNGNKNEMISANTPALLSFVSFVSAIMIFFNG